MASGTPTRITSRGWRGREAPRLQGSRASTDVAVSAVSKRQANRAIASAFVREINAKTSCSICGSQPIEWHGEHHLQKPNARVSSLRAQGCSVERIKQEMAQCVPLCRTCHMTEDGRLAALRDKAPYQKGQEYTQPKPCACCGKPTKPLRNAMCVTCDNHHSGRRLRKTKSCDRCCG